MNIFDTWRTELESELADAAVERDAALKEQDEAERAEAGTRAELADAFTAIDTLGRRIDTERGIQEAGAVILRGAPPAIATALTLRLDDLREAARAARTRTIRAGHATDQTTARIADLRRAQVQLDMVAVGDEGVAA
ncbi:MAG TPA: hypothetical protein VFC78_17920 [Tepidisphaeraceae bacterium]|nr:hypothetical protein [Tepidisphaeraceae bacterium]